MNKFKQYSKIVSKKKMFIILISVFLIISLSACVFDIGKKEEKDSTINVDKGGGITNGSKPELNGTWIDSDKSKFIFEGISTEKYNMFTKNGKIKLAELEYDLKTKILKGTLNHFGYKMPSVAMVSNDRKKMKLILTQGTKFDTTDLKFVSLSMKAITDGSIDLSLNKINEIISVNNNDSVKYSNSEKFESKMVYIDDEKGRNNKELKIASNISKNTVQLDIGYDSTDFNLSDEMYEVSESVDTNKITILFTSNSVKYIALTGKVSFAGANKTITFADKTNLDKAVMLVKFDDIKKIAAAGITGGIPNILTAGYDVFLLSGKVINSK